jgi:hypothetical protein
MSCDGLLDRGGSLSHSGTVEILEGQRSKENKRIPSSHSFPIDLVTW